MDMPRYLELFTSIERALLFTLQTRVSASEICRYFNSQNTVLLEIQLIHPFQKKLFHRYTSVGERTNTVPNPYLKRKNSLTGKDEYLHADQLENDEYERAGRL